MTASAAGLLTMMWLPLIGRTLGADTVPELAGATILTVQALDRPARVSLFIAAS